MSNISQSSSLCNIITEGSKLVGSIISDTDTRIDGQMEGDITSKGKVVLGGKGRVKGNIQCENIEIFGNFEGKLYVGNTLTLHSTSKIESDVITRNLIIESGAIFDGTCSMSKERQKEKDSK